MAEIRKLDVSSTPNCELMRIKVIKYRVLFGGEVEVIDVTP